MKFKEALEELRKGKKIALPGWNGYRTKENDSVFMNCKDRRIDEQDDTIDNIAREDWEVKPDNYQWYLPKNGHYYNIIRNVKMKDPTSREWLSAVEYTDGKDIYVREEKEFYKKFRKTPLK